MLKFSTTPIWHMVSIDREPKAFIHVKRGRRFDGLIILVLLKD